MDEKNVCGIERRYPRTLMSADEVKYEVFQEDDPKYQVRHPNGILMPDGLKLKVIRALLKGDEGEVRGAWNDWYPVSLKPWADADAEKTYLRITVPSIMEKMRTPEWMAENEEKAKAEGEREYYKNEIRVFKAEEVENQLSFALFGYLLGGISLTAMRRDLGGDEGYHRAPSGEDIFVSLLPWKDEDPDLTFIEIRSYSRPKGSAKTHEDLD